MKVFEILLWLVTYDVTKSVIVDRLINDPDEGLVTCLGVCQCDGSKGLVDCSGQGLNRIPRNLPSGTITLILSGNNIEAIGESDFFDAESVENLNLRNNLIATIDRSSFQRLSLKTLDLAGNQLSAWNASVIEPVAHSLQILDLSSNNIQEIRLKMFDVSLLQLRELTLTDNGLRHIDDHSFREMGNLGALRLGRNLIKTLSNKTFSGLHLLQELHLDSNFFNDFPPQSAFEPIKESLLVFSFSGHNRISRIRTNLDFPHLQTFNVSHCNLDFLQNFTFIGAPSLKVLDLSNNFIRSLAAESLSGMEQLQSLILTHNGFVSFPYRALSEVSSSLENLFFDNNAIYRIIATPSIDHLLSNLKVLSLRNTFLTEIDGSSFFRQLHSLKSLRISSSRLDTIPKQALADMIKLEELEFSGNLIPNLTSSSFPTISSLTHLRLDQSELLTHVANDTFTSVGANLTFLSISGGALEEVAPRGLIGLDKLTHLDLSNNAMGLGHPEWAKGKDLVELKLAGNAWSCDCEMQEFQQWLKSRQYLEIPYRDQITCHYPRDLRGRPISDVDESLLSCDWTECPTICLCGHIEPPLNAGNTEARTNNFTHVDCSYEGLHSPPTSLPLTALGLRLDNNHFTHLNQSTFDGVHNLEKIWIGNNEITMIQDTSFDTLHKLFELDLHSNQLEELSPYTFHNLSRLEVLRLDQNWLRFLQPRLFSQQSKLLMLDLSSNQIQNIDDDLFVGLHRLEELLLADNVIEDVTSLAFRHLGSLRHLYLSGNRFSFLTSNFVEGLEKLESLDLSGNRIERLGARFLVSPSLVYLKMEKNNIEVIDDDAFARTPELQTLRLKENLIRNISLEAFRTETENKLRSLDLSSNKLQSFPARPLAPASNLQALYLNKNPIQNLSAHPAIAYPFLPELQTLQLAHVDVTNIGMTSVLRYLPSVQTLLMNNAQLTSVPGSILTSLPLLETLNLDANPINNITEGDFPPHPNLKSFSLSFNKILTKIPDSAFSHLVNLRALQLSEGGITHLHWGAFRNLSQLQSLDLSGNQLKTPHKDWFDSFLSAHLRAVSLYNNPWSCDCPSLLYKEWVVAGAGGLTPYSLSIQCDEPMLFKGTRIEDADIRCPSTGSSAQMTSLPVSESHNVTDGEATTISDVEQSTSGSNEPAKLNSILFYILVLISNVLRHC